MPQPRTNFSNGARPVGGCSLAFSDAAGQRWCYMLRKVIALGVSAGMLITTIILLLMALTGCVATQASATPEPGKQFLQWQAKPECQPVYLPTKDPGLYITGIRCPK
jgi:hypothetical protein